MVTMILQTVGGVVLTACLCLTGWCLNRVSDLSTNQAVTANAVGELNKRIDREINVADKTHGDIYETIRKEREMSDRQASAALSLNDTRYKSLDEQIRSVGNQVQSLIAEIRRP